MPKTHETREGWLRDLTEGLRPILRERADIKLPKDVLVSCGWPSRGGTARVKKRIGECWVSSPGTPIFISPVVVTPFEVAAVHAHELIHAALPKGTGHRAPFARAALAMNLGGKPTATERTPAFDDLVRSILAGLGPYPHKKIDYSERKKQGMRMLKLSCGDCGYVVRTTQKWIEAGLPPRLRFLFRAGGLNDGLHEQAHHQQRAGPQDGHRRRPHAAAADARPSRPAR